MNSKKHIQWLSLLIVFLVFFSFGQSAWAQQTWTGALSSDWNTAGNWTSAVPLATDDVTIPNGTANDPIIGAGTNAVALSITINGDGHLSMTGAAPTLTVTNDFTISAGGTFDASAATGAADISIGGNFSNSATGIVNLTVDVLATITISGTITNTAGGTITTDATTNLVLDGTGAVTLPAAFTPLGTLTVNKTDGAIITLGGPITVGDATAADDIVITQGYINLNGTSHITLANAAGEINETAPYKIINNGASGAYVVTQSTTSANLILSGIGITSISPAGTYTIYRYPMPASSPITITGVGSALDRVYRVTGVPTAITLQFDNTDVNSLITDLSLYTSSALTMSSAIEQNTTGDANRTIGLAAGKSEVAYSSFKTAVTTDNYYTLASEDLPANTKVFTGLNSVNWNDAGNWNPSGVPTATDNVLIPSGEAVTVDAGAVCDDITITDATATVANGITLDINGDLTLNGTSALTAATATSVVTFTGAAVQTITVAEDSYCEFGDLTIDNNSNGVTTASNITMRDLLTTTSGAFTQTAGTFTFNPLAASNLWAATGAITLNDVILNIGGGATPATPATGITINGDFTKIGTGLFTASAGTITFTNTNLAGKTLQAAGGATTFFNIAVSAGSKINTTSSFSLAGNSGSTISIGSNAEFIADAGEITLTGNNALIANSGTLEFNNLTNAATAVSTSTASDFTIKGDFENEESGIFGATAGTITFENATEKTITNAGANDENELLFWNLKIAESSDLTSGDIFTIQGNLNLESNSALTVTGGAGIETHFEPTASTQTITVADNATLSFSDVIIGATTDGTVTTTDSFDVIGTAFTITGAADYFNATDGTITFSANTLLTNPTNTNLIFNNVILDDADVTDAAGDFVQFRGNLTIDGTGSYVSSTTSTVTFIGTTNSTIGGTAVASPAAQFAILVINKTGATGSDEVILGTNIAIQDAAGTTITLTDGILNLGSATLTAGARVLPSGAGAINGASGTYSVAATHADGLTDALFTINGTPTLYNFVVGDAVSLGAGNLTINGNLTLNASLTILSARTVTLYGNLTQSGAAFDIVGNADGTSVLKLKGSGSCATLADALFTNQPSLIFERGEVLTGSLTMIASNTLTINTSTQYLDLSSYTLTLNNTTVLNRASGGIDADNGVVVLGTSHTTIPANLFKNNIVKDLTIVAPTTLGGDLTINGTLSGVFMVTTNNNTLTFGPNAGALPFTDAAHVVGNLQRTVTSTATLFPIGDGTANGYAPVSLQFETAGSSQVVKVSSQKVNPTYGRGGDPTKVVNALWTITPTGTAPTDNMKITASWDADYDNGALSFANDRTFIAKWNGSSWSDYRAATNVYNAGPPKSLTPSTFDINASSLSGPWAVFSATTNSNTDKDLAISVSRNKLAIKNITPSTIEAGVPFTATVELQDQYGNGIVADTAVTLTFTDVIDNGTATYPVGVIPVGSSSVVINGFAYTNASIGNQFKVTGAGKYLQDGISPTINVIGVLPSDQVNTIALTASTTSTTMTFALASGSGIIIAKAGSAITSNDFPVDGVTYFASNNFGEGSKIGDAVVVYKGGVPGSAVTISGLAPNTTYYFRGFSYGAATAGTEKYLTFAAANNPKSVTTSGSSNNDDDTDYGTNNTMETAKPIGANSPIKGTIKTSDDVDWFSFTITNSAPNLRARLTLLAALGNYNVELYNVDGRRLRRGTRLSNNVENQVINELEPGTYLVKISGVDGAYDPDDYYTLQLTTDGNEIFSVTE